MYTQRDFASLSYVLMLEQLGLRPLSACGLSITRNQSPTLSNDNGFLRPMDLDRLSTWYSKSFQMVDRLVQLLKSRHPCSNGTIHGEGPGRENGQPQPAHDVHHSSALTSRTATRDPVKTCLSNVQRQLSKLPGQVGDSGQGGEATHEATATTRRRRCNHKITTGKSVVMLLTCRAALLTSSSWHQSASDSHQQCI